MQIAVVVLKGERVTGIKNAVLTQRISSKLRKLKKALAQARTYFVTVKRGYGSHYLIYRRMPGGTKKKRPSVLYFVRKWMRNFKISGRTGGSCMSKPKRGYTIYPNPKQEDYDYQLALAYKTRSVVNNSNACWLGRKYSACLT